ncbi:MAG: hypothetical protein ABIO49_13110 [Dokdonella sp.]
MRIAELALRSLVTAGALVVAVAAIANEPYQRTASVSLQTLATSVDAPWQLSADEVSISLNPDALAALGIRIADVVGVSARTPGVPGLRYDVATYLASGKTVLEVMHRGTGVSSIGTGSLRVAGGMLLTYPGGRVDLRGFSLQGNPTAPIGMVIADTAGAIWFTADHAHFGFDADSTNVLSVSNMNLRVSARFAAALGRQELTGYPIGNLEFRARTLALDDAGIDGGTCSAPWPAVGLTTDIQLTYSNLSGFYDSIYAPRCGLPPLPGGGACTVSSTNGKLVLGSDASLRNAGQTAVAWYSHFSSNSPPYNNDQHPYLIWNLYRVDSAGRIRQIGASGVKHAFYSVNLNCGCAGANVIWPGCDDVYSVSSNDNGGGGATQNLAPRSEIIPHTAQWGRCGSVWDADCNGQMDAGSGAQDLYQYRMQVTESDMLAPLSTGAHYYFEYWYVVRDDSNIYNTMGYREIQPQKNGANWLVNLVDANAADHDFFAGPAINRWVDPVSPPPYAMNRELATPLGRARIAVKATSLGSGQWRYEYAVMNFDYAHAAIDPAHASEPNMKLLSNHGFVRLSVPLPAGVVATNLRFDDADNDTGNDWVATSGNGAVMWTASAPGDALDWGKLNHFEFTAGAAPATNSLTLVGAATLGEGALSYALALLGPQVSGDIIFPNGFD